MKKIISENDFRHACEDQIEGIDGAGYKNVAFVCPVCRTVQSAESWRRAKLKYDCLESVLAFSCIGRMTGAGEYKKGADGKGCDYTGGGLFKLNPLHVLIAKEDGQPVVRQTFDLASPEEAKRLFDLHQNDPEAIVAFSAPKK